MKSNTVLDYVVFQLSPKHLRCDLFVSSSGQTEKLASGLIEEIASHLKVVEGVAPDIQSSIKLEVDDNKHAKAWFTKGTLERFVQFVSTPEALELVNKLDAELSQLEAAKSLYCQGNGDGTEASTSDSTKKELLRAIDLRLDAVKKDLTMAFYHASAAGLNPDTVSDLKKFADQFDAHRLDKACTKFMLVCQRRADLNTSWKSSLSEQAVRSSWTSDISTDDPSKQSNTTQMQHPTNQLKHAMPMQSMPITEFEPQHKPSQNEKNLEENRDESLNKSSTSQPSKQLGRQLSVQDRINLFESKQKENSTSGGKPLPVGKSIEARRLSSDASSAPAFTDTSLLRRRSGVSDIYVDVSSDNNFDCSTDNPLCKPPSLPSGQSDLKDQIDRKGRSDSVSSIEADPVHGGNGAANYNWLNSQFSSEGENEKIDGESDYRTGNVESTNQHKMQSTVTASKSHTRSCPAQIEGNSGIKSKDMLCKEADGDLFGTEPVWTSFAQVISEAKTEPALSEKQSSLTPRMKVRRPASAAARSEDIKRSKGRKDDTDTKVPENSALVPVPLDQAQRTKQSKENQRLNDELKMKANELEKLFADHKFRVAADQSSSSRRSTHGEGQNEQTAPKAKLFTEKNTMLNSSRSSSQLPMLSTAQPRKMLSNHDCGDNLRLSFSDLSFSDDSRGKFYEKYTEKRDAKLREEWSLKSVDKEAKLKAMQDAFEQSRNEMEAKFSWSSERKDSPSSTRHRAEKFRSFNSQTSMKNSQHPISSFQSEEDELSDYSDQRYHGMGLQFNGKVGDGASRSSQTRKLNPKRNTSSATPRAANSPIPLSSPKVSSTDSARRREQSTRALAQSVPNFADHKKENTKPTSGVAKNAACSQVRNNIRSKSTSKEVSLVKKERTRRPQSLRKSSFRNLEVADLSALNPDGELVSSELDREQSEREGGYDDFYPDAESDTSNLRATENMKHEETGELGLEAESLETTTKEEEQVLPDETAVEDVDAQDYEKPRLSGVDSRTGNGDSMGPISQDEVASVPDSPATVPSTIHVVASLLDSPGESPMSWSSRLRQPFSYPHETSDIDASADSPLGSPASWNSRMRKKWGSAQNPVMTTNASQSQARKDVTKGFKRFLRFGKKNRGPDSLMDWLSVTTSEGDDDTDDGRDLGTRSSEDLRKSRMGFMQSHPSDDGFHENELLSEHGQIPSSSSPVPPPNLKLKDDLISGSPIKASRSFFSLSNFRSKGIDTNPR